MEGQLPIGSEVKLFKPLMFRTQVVRGVHYFIKVRHAPLTPYSLASRGQTGLGLATQDYPIPRLSSRGSVGLGNTSLAICELTVCFELSLLHMVPTSAQKSLRWSSKSQLLSHQGQDAILQLVDRSSMPLSHAPFHLQLSFQTAAFLRLVQRSSIQLRKWSGHGPGMRLVASLMNTVVLWS